MMAFEVDPVQYYLIEAEIHDILQPQLPTRSTCTSASGSVSSEEEQKRRRMISNRESAKRSRQRKKRRLQELTDQLKQLRMENVELKTRLTSVVNHRNYVLTQNCQLQSESLLLQSKLSALCQLLVCSRTFSCMN
ncbi:unnamed protein product [Lactuca saligna]|uniref:BZIP domain-containing protein n=1 Tax=Lactuca saligna TaxID=75948 RepID=A0AA36ERH7_LACSI|nr:unnamed protein product [Lactuca saligna]